MVGKLLFDKRWIRPLGITLLIFLALLGIMRACFSSSGPVKSTYHLIARNINWDEFQFSGKELNVQAFAEDLVLAASKEAHLHVQFVTANSHTLIEDLLADKYGAVFTFLTPNSINKEIFAFSDPLYKLGAVLVVRKDLEADSLEQMEDKIIGVGSGASYIYDVEHYPSMIIVTFDNMNTALNELAHGKIDGVIMDTWNAHVNIHGFFANQLKIATPPFTHEGLRLVALAEQDKQEFIKSFNDGLERVKASGLYQQLLRKWELY
jgi:polar amino acid transport system substrate-binding protein